MKIVAAAVYANGLIFTKPAPARHHHILNSMAKDFGIDASIHGSPDAQGFLTDQGEFLDRRLAMVCAIDAGQLEQGKWGFELYSEDLW